MGACGSLGPCGHDVSLAQVTGVHTVDNCVVLDKQCGGSAVVLSSASRFVS